MTTGDMETHIKELYGIKISDSTISRITDRVLPIAREWQNRPLENIYAVVFMDAIQYNVKQDGRTIKKSVYAAIGINSDGKKEVLRLWIGENESFKYMESSILSHLSNLLLVLLFVIFLHFITAVDNDKLLQFLLDI